MWRCGEAQRRCQASLNGQVGLTVIGKAPGTVPRHWPLVEIAEFSRLAPLAVAPGRACFPMLLSLPSLLPHEGSLSRTSRLGNC
jgi:hypothetical protein